MMGTASTRHDMSASERDRPVVLIVAQAFKGSMRAAEVAAGMAAGVERAGGRARVLLGSDGGDGLLEALGDRLSRRQEMSVTGPRGNPVTAEVGWLDEAVAVVESRMVCGLSALQPGERDPLVTTTRGVGELVELLASAGARELFIGLGGSATVDGGVGMARAWGWVPRDRHGTPLAEGGGALIDLDRLDPGDPPAPPTVRLTGLCDVTNPLTGPEGARVYARQKGASEEAEARLSRGLDRLAELAARAGQPDLAEQPGAGAAGGLGFGILFFGGGMLIPGAKWVLERLPFSESLGVADLVVTGEGAFDATSLDGKLTGEVVQAARSARIPVVLVAPSVRSAPDDVHVESGRGRWTRATLETRTAAAVARVLRLLPR